MQNLTRWMLVGAAVAVLAGCDDDDDDDNTPAPGPQTPPSATIYLHDAPPDVRQVIAHLDSVQVHVAGADAPGVADPNGATEEARWKTIPVDQELNLAASQGPDQAVSLGTIPLPQGKITQLRLNLNPEKGMRLVMFGDGSCMVDPSELPATGVRVTKAFKTIATNPNDNLEIWLDLDLDASLTRRGDGCYNFLPVLKVSRIRNNGQDVAVE